MYTFLKIMKSHLTKLLESDLISLFDNLKAKKELS